MAFILASVTNAEVIKLVASFLTLKALNNCLNNSFFIAVPVSDLTKVLWNGFFCTRIVCYINFGGRCTRITNISVFFIEFLLCLLFFLLFLNVIRGFYTFKKVCRLKLLGFWLRLFGFIVFRVVSFV